MYLRTVKAKGAEGVEFEYIRLVEAYWESGRSKQRIIAKLGRKDLLAPHLESLIELLRGILLFNGDFLGQIDGIGGAD